MQIPPLWESLGSDCHKVKNIFVIDIFKEATIVMIDVQAILLLLSKKNIDFIKYIYKKSFEESIQLKKSIKGEKTPN